MGRQSGRGSPATIHAITWNHKAREDSSATQRSGEMKCAGLPPDVSMAAPALIEADEPWSRHGSRQRDG